MKNWLILQENKVHESIFVWQMYFVTKSKEFPFFSSKTFMWTPSGFYYHFISLDNSVLTTQVYRFKCKRHVFCEIVAFYRSFNVLLRNVIIVRNTFWSERRNIGGWQLPQNILSEALWISHSVRAAREAIQSHSERSCDCINSPKHGTEESARFQYFHKSSNVLMENIYEVSVTVFTFSSLSIVECTSNQGLIFIQCQFTYSTHMKH